MLDNWGSAVCCCCCCGCTQFIFTENLQNTKGMNGKRERFDSVCGGGRTDGRTDGREERGGGSDEDIG